MKVIVNISLKEGVLDPQGQAIRSSLSNLGFYNCSDVRTGKQIILSLDQNNETKALTQAKKMCEELLVNTVIENYEINILKD
jgi:phosphoribosylformylglycinamidine synthase